MEFSWGILEDSTVSSEDNECYAHYRQPYIETVVGGDVKLTLTMPSIMLFCTLVLSKKVQKENKLKIGIPGRLNLSFSKCFPGRWNHT